VVSVTVRTWFVETPFLTGGVRLFWRHARGLVFLTFESPKTTPFLNGRASAPFGRHAPGIVVVLLSLLKRRLSLPSHFSRDGAHAGMPRTGTLRHRPGTPGHASAPFGRHAPGIVVVLLSLLKPRLSLPSHPSRDGAHAGMPRTGTLCHRPGTPGAGFCLFLPTRRV
jgi:hypothetical protein